MFRFNTDKFEIARRRAKLSNKEICILIGITPGTLCSWKSGKNTPGSENLTKLAKVLELNSSELMIVAEKEGEDNNNRMQSTLLNGAAAVMAIREELLDNSHLNMTEEDTEELLQETERYFNKLWGIITNIVKI